MDGLFKYLFLVLVIFSCKQNSEMPIENSRSEEEQIQIESKNVETKIEVNTEIDYKSLFANNAQYIAKSFDFPVTKSNTVAFGFSKFQKFGANNFADDLNGTISEDIFIDKPIYAVANGYITQAKDHSTKWGNVIRTVHLYNEHLYESLFAHCNTIQVKPNQFVKKGEQIGTVLTCNNLYHTHLYFEFRDSLNMAIGKDYNTYSDPSDLIKKPNN